MNEQDLEIVEPKVVASLMKKYSLPSSFLKEELQIDGHVLTLLTGHLTENILFSGQQSNLFGPFLMVCY